MSLLGYRGFKMIYIFKGPRNVLKTSISQTIILKFEALFSFLEGQGPGASFFILTLTCAESNANERKQELFLICIRFGTWKVRRLKRALES